VVASWDEIALALVADQRQFIDAASVQKASNGLEAPNGDNFPVVSLDLNHAYPQHPHTYTGIIGEYQNISMLRATFPLY
jgi:hypothetical protein